MTLRLQIMVIIFIVLAVLYIVNQLRKKKLDYRFGLGWLLIIFCILVLTVSPKLLSMLAGFLGITLPINMLFFFGFCFIVILVFSMSMMISSLSDRVKKLSQEIAILRKDALTVVSLAGSIGFKVAESKTIKNSYDGYISEATKVTTQEERADYYEKEHKEYI